MTLHRVNPFVQDHDPSDKTDYTFRFRLNDSESVVSATVTVMDPATDEPPIVPTDLVLADVSFGTMFVEGTPGIWGVTVWVSGGTAGTSYYLSCLVTTNSTPTARVFNRTMRLHCSDQ